jgi:hypothetical protein
MERRTFLAMISGGLLAAPLAAGAQQVGKLYRVGYLGTYPPTPSTAPIVSAFTDGLRDTAMSTAVTSSSSTGGPTDVATYGRRSCVNWSRPAFRWSSPRRRPRH